MVFISKLRGNWIYLILLYAAIFRIIYCFSAPNIDEGFHLKNIHHFFSHKTIMADMFFYPAFTNYLMALFTGIGSIYYWMTGLIPSPSAISYLHIENPTLVYLPVRLAGSILNVFCVYLIYLIGSKNFSKTTGIIAAIVFALSPLNIGKTSYMLTETYLVFFSTLQLWACILIAKHGKTKHYIYAAATLGAATASKYNGCFTSLTLLGAHLYHLADSKQLFNARKWFLFCSCAPISVIIFFILNPTWLFQINDYLGPEGIGASMRLANEGKLGSYAQPLDLLKNYFAIEQGLAVISTLSLLGLFFSKVQLRYLLLCGVFPVIAYFSLSSKIAAAPYIIFIYPSIALSCGLYTSMLIHKKGYYRHITLTVLFFVISPILINQVTAINHPFQEDNREISKEWIYQNIPTGERIAVDRMYTPFLWNQNEKDVLLAKHPDYAPAAKEIKTYDRKDFRIPGNWDFEEGETPLFLLETGASWLITSSYYHNRFLINPPPS